MRCSVGPQSYSPGNEFMQLDRIAFTSVPHQYFASVPLWGNFTTFQLKGWSGHVCMHHGLPRSQQSKFSGLTFLLTKEKNSLNCACWCVVVHVGQLGTWRHFLPPHPDSSLEKSAGGEWHSLSCGKWNAGSYKNDLYSEGLFSGLFVQKWSCSKSIQCKTQVACIHKSS